MPINIDAGSIRVASPAQLEAARAALLSLCAPRDLDSFRRAIVGMGASGLDGAWWAPVCATLLTPLFAQLLAPSRLERRDRAVAALRQFVEPGSDRHVAGEIAKKLRRYAATRWKSEQCADAAPLVHGAEGAALHAIMSLGPIGFAAIRPILAKARADDCLVIPPALAVSQRAAQPAPGSSERRGVNLENNITDALKALARAPATLKLLADNHQAEVAQRREHLQRIAALDAKAAVDHPAGLRAMAEAVAKRRKSERAYRDDDDAVRAVAAATANATALYTRSRQAEEQALLDSADVAVISSWRREILDEIDTLGRRGVLASAELVEKDPVTLKTSRFRWSNSASIAARRSALLAAFRSADLLALEEDQRALPAIIARIRSSWPKVEASAAPANERS